MKYGGYSTTPLKNSFSVISKAKVPVPKHLVAKMLRGGPVIWGVSSGRPSSTSRRHWLHNRFCVPLTGMSWVDLSICSSLCSAVLSYLALRVPLGHLSVPGLFTAWPEATFQVSITNRYSDSQPGVLMFCANTFVCLSPQTDSKILGKDSEIWENIFMFLFI